VDGKIRSWDPERGTLLGKKQVFDVECWTHEQALQIAAHGLSEDLCFIPEKTFLAAYCMRSGEQLCRLEAHTGTVTCAEALTGCGRVLSAGADGRLLCWRAALSAAAEAPVEDVICLD